MRQLAVGTAGQQFSLWREALGPRGGSRPGEPLLKNDPVARNLPSPSDEIELHASAFKGGNHATGTKEFPT